MGDLQTEAGEALELRWVPAAEFARVRQAPGNAAARAAAFAALARINTLYMIEGAWSGHIGTSFSSIEIMSWLFLNELRDLEQGPEACDIFFSSKGHDAPALYNVLIGLGLLPAAKLHQLRRLHGSRRERQHARRKCKSLRHSNHLPTHPETRHLSPLHQSGPLSETIAWPASP